MAWPLRDGSAPFLSGNRWLFRVTWEAWSPPLSPGHFSRIPLQWAVFLLSQKALVPLPMHPGLSGTWSLDALVDSHALGAGRWPGGSREVARRQPGGPPQPSRGPFLSAAVNSATLLLPPPSA